VLLRVRRGRRNRLRKEFWGPSLGGRGFHRPILRSVSRHFEVDVDITYTLKTPV
jgi:hypothetical protein